MLYPRIIEKRIKDNLFKGQIIILYGLRQVGKTTLVKKIFDEYTGKKVFFRCDIPSEREPFKEPEPSVIIKALGDAQLVVLDEAQLIENIGVVLKVMIDVYPDIQFIVTGSSSFDLANKTREPLTGRAIEYLLYPLSYEEVYQEHGLVSMKQQFENFLKYGWYPRIVNASNTDAREYLEILQNNTLYKDIFVLENIKKPAVLENLAIFLANNIGSIVRIGNIAREIKTTEVTVNRYMNLLEKMFIIIKIPTFSKNPNNELKGGYKVYFTDVGFRNSIVKNYTDSSLRLDKGALFENFFIIERIKFLNNHRKSSNHYFWQNYKQVEVDYIEESDGMLDVFECKFQDRKTKSIEVFRNEYKDMIRTVTIIDKDNYQDFLLDK